MKPSDYASVRAENEKRYGTDIGRIGPMLLAHRYDDRTHFIFELLQNAEDALRRRPTWEGSRTVSFHLSSDVLRMTHSGKPFDEDDVRGICGIGQSTHAVTDIGRFGIGFKSVYAVTDRPEIHSGAEDFAIENFVWPTAAPRMVRDPNETVMILPLRDASAREEISRGLQKLSPRVLLFLRYIEAISWTVDEGPSGLYLRDTPEVVDGAARRVVLIGEQQGVPDMEETWLVFSQEVRADRGTAAGHAEIAFSIGEEEAPIPWPVHAVDESPLVVFFPTVVQTYLGFLVQGPYRTTPSRDNVPRNDAWNRHLVSETAALLVRSLRWLREHGSLDSAALQCLPLDSTKFGEDTMFAPLFESVRRAFMSEALLPGFSGRHVPSGTARLARTQELRDLLDRRQLGMLQGVSGELNWLTGDISADRTPQLRQYLMQELGVAEITPESIVGGLTRSFLEAQPDRWIMRLYEFLNDQPAIKRRAEEQPLVRLENGAHVQAVVDGQPQAFLPGPIRTGFPTVRREVCATESAREFLVALGLSEPDPVDDVVRNVLPRYRTARDEIDVDELGYEADIDRIGDAFATDSQAQRDKLLAALRDSYFVRAVDCGDASKRFALPEDVYLATARLKRLFDGVSGVLIADDSCACLQGEKVRELLEACGVTRYMRPIPVESPLTWGERRQLRIDRGVENNTGPESVKDFTLRGLDALLMILPSFDAATKAGKAQLLWDALADLEERRGASAFSGTYTWFYFHERSTTFDANFVRRLNEAAWVPDSPGDLQRPEFAVFESLGWNSEAFLLSKIHFKPSTIATLAKEAGIEPGVLDLLKKLGLTSEADLRARLGIEGQGGDPAPLGAVRSTAAAQDSAEDRGPAVPENDLSAAESDAGSAEGAAAEEGASAPLHETHGAAAHGSTRQMPERSEAVGDSHSARAERREFITYVAVHASETETDPDGLDEEARMALEEKAIELILAAEPGLQRTPPLNPGYDLFEVDSAGQPIRWIEVKAMTGSLKNRPVGLSSTQFEYARVHHAAYWLYIVEHAADAAGSRIVRIQDPFGKAKTFTFDRGWLEIGLLV